MHREIAPESQDHLNEGFHEGSQLKKQKIELFRFLQRKEKTNQHRFLGNRKEKQGADRRFEE